MSGAYSSRKEVREIIKQLENQGWTCVNTRSGHVRVYNPEGDYVHQMSGTPGRSGMTISKRKLRKAGAEIK